MSNDDNVNYDEQQTDEDVKYNVEGIEKSIANKLTQEELNTIKKNKEEHKAQKAAKAKKEDEKPKTIEEELNYSKDELTEVELKMAAELQDALVGFIKEKTDLQPGTGIKKLLPSGIDLIDTVAGGGFAAGALTLIVGNPGTFKSCLVGQIIATNQIKYRGQVLNIYMDSEQATTRQRLMNLGVKNPPINPWPARSVEDVFKTIETLCTYKELNKKQENPSIIAWDSLANTISDKEKESTDLDINKFIGLKARIISILLPKYIAKIEEYNIGLFVINQLREKIDMGYVPTANDLRWIGNKNMPGGNSVKFNAFHLLLLKIKGDLKAEEWGFHGVMLDAKFIKNKLFTPNIPVTLVVDFNKGISNFWTNWHMLCETKRATSSAWCSLKTLPTIKFRKKEVQLTYNSNPSFKVEFDRLVQETLKTEYLDKYSADGSFSIEKTDLGKDIVEDLDIDILTVD